MMAQLSCCITCSSSNRVMSAPHSLRLQQAEHPLGTRTILSGSSAARLGSSLVVGQFAQRVQRLAGPASS